MGMKVQLLIWTIWLGVGLAGCSIGKARFTSISVDEVLQVDLPTSMDPTTRLSRDTVMQWEDIHAELYLILRTDVWADLLIQDPAYSIEDAFDYHAKNLAISLEDFTLVEDSLVHQTDSLRMEGTVTGIYHSDSLVYFLCIRQTTESLYQMLIWTRADLLEQNLPYIERIQQSFMQ